MGSFPCEKGNQIICKSRQRVPSSEKRVVSINQKSIDSNPLTGNKIQIFLKYNSIYPKINSFEQFLSKKVQLSIEHGV